MTGVQPDAGATHRRHGGRRALWFGLGATLLLGVLVMLALSVGRYPVAPGEIAALVWMKLTGTAAAVSPSAETVIFSVRAPRVLTAIVIGAALAAAGAAYQGMFRNPLVSPDILGVSAGAGLGAVLAIFLSLPVLAIQGFAFVGGIVAVAAVYFVGSAVRGHDPILALILAGVVIGTLLGSCIALLKYLADPYNQLPAITFWLLGSLASVGPQDLKAVLPLVLVALAPMFLLRWRMNLLSLADDEARALGVHTGLLRIVIVCAATLMTAASVAVSGIIGWVGLLIPHAARMLVGPEFSRLLPVAMLLGASYLLGVDTLARTMARIEVPPGVLTAVIGTPFFVWLLAASRRTW